MPPSASGQEANELEAALEAVEQAMPNGGDDGVVDGVPVDLPGMTAEMRLMTGNLRYLAACSTALSDICPFPTSATHCAPAVTIMSCRFQPKFFIL